MGRIARESKQASVEEKKRKAKEQGGVAEEGRKGEEKEKEKKWVMGQKVIMNCIMYCYFWLMMSCSLWQHLALRALCESLSWIVRHVLVM